MYDEVSKFPDEVDGLIFYSDTSIDKKPIADQHTALINEGLYSEASQLAKDGNLDGQFAGLYNMLENRILALQTEVVGKEKHNPHYFTSPEPSAEESEMWVQLDCGIHSLLAQYPHEALHWYTHEELRILF